ncbi:MAG TPA: NAD+ synthase, partial [Thermoleophilia bacterium]|nr:NAD+ synthase [Thermoleophilia bacterium]
GSALGADAGDPGIALGADAGDLGTAPGADVGDPGIALVAGAGDLGTTPVLEAPGDDLSPEAEVWGALVLGVRDYVAKSGFGQVLLGLSGGIDSALVAAVAAEALGPENVLAVLMPSPFSSAGSVSDAQELADGLGIRTVTLPIADLATAGATCVVNMAASPFSIGKQRHREDMIGATARKYGVPVLYVNQVGGADELVFDGRSCAFRGDGSVAARAAAFASDLLLVDLDELTGAEAPGSSPDLGPEAEVWGALVLGVRDYVAKSGFRQVLLGLSGGIDSALVAAVAAEALGPENVLAVLMPSPFSSAGSVSDAQDLADALAIRTVTLPIADLMAAFETALAPVFAGRPAGVTEENVQARIRGNLLMALSNKFDSLLLTTGNKSELAVGYCTIYGDMSGGLAVISDVPKTMVYAVARHLNEWRGREVIPRAILEKAPSAELRPDQTDQDSLPPYDVLDGILALLIEEHLGAGEIEARGYERATVERVVRLVAANEFKRKQAAPGLKVTDRAFGMGWRMPIATVPRGRRSG